MQQSEYLKELDLSWSNVMPEVWREFAQVIKSNRQLSCLSLGYNKILKDEAGKVSFK